jgi:hypothetical protein
MNPQKLALYQKIQAFTLDKPNVYFTYSQRLARDHQWSNDYSQRVIEEYKKFLFLAIAAGHPVTPSVAVDEAWHLHLTYTRSYWDELCGQVLGKPLHHHPTQGGQQQRQLFENCYAQTLESYQRFFGCPPDDIWPSSTRRFNPAEQIRQINQQDYWLIPKSSLMSLRQILGRFSQNLWLKGIVISLLMLGLVLSLSPAVAQVSSSSDHQISLFKTFQQWLLDNLFVGFGIVVSGISFLIGFILSLLLSLQPVFILPIESNCEAATPLYLVFKKGSTCPLPALFCKDIFEYLNQTYPSVLFALLKISVSSLPATLSYLHDEMNKIDKPITEDTNIDNFVCFI